MHALRCRSLVGTLALGVFSGAGLYAQAEQGSVQLVLESGRPLRVQVDRRITIKRVSQTISGTLVEPVYVHDRLVLATGDRVWGHISALTPPPTGARVSTILAGDFSPHYTVEVQFDAVTTGGGRRIEIATRSTSGAPRALAVAKTAPSPGLKGRVRRVVRDKAEETSAAIKGSRHLSRLRDLALSQLPYHSQVLPAGTTYSATLTAPVDFGAATPLEEAPAGTPLPPSSILHVRLLMPLSSSGTPRGTPLHAVLSQPVLAENQRLILPEGTAVEGEVTFARPPRSLRRNGQLRFLIQSMHAPAGRARLLASLYAADVMAGGHLSIDDEGGASLTNPKTRFIAPALAVLTLGNAFDNGEAEAEGALGEAGGGAEYGNRVGRGVAGGVGSGLLGFAVSQLSRPAAVAFGFWGLARSVYGGVLRKGNEVSFPADTPMEIQTSPKPALVR